MDIQFGTGVRNALLDAIETNIGASAKLQIRTGAKPADCQAANSGTLLDQIDLPADWMDAAASGSKAKLGTWAANATASGRAVHFRIFDSTLATCGVQGICSEAWVAAKVYVAGDYVTNDGGKLYVCTTGGTSAGSGGPTGTGTGITDGSAVWDYAGAATHLGLDNIVINSGQAVTINTFTLTAPGA